MTDRRLRFTELRDAVGAYIDHFDEGPPIWGMTERQAMRAIEKAIEEDEPMTGPSADVPPDCLL